MITVTLNQFIPHLICAKPILIKFDFGDFTNFCIKQVKSNLVNTNTEGSKESVRINGVFVLSGLHFFPRDKANFRNKEVSHGCPY